MKALNLKNDLIVWLKYQIMKTKTSGLVFGLSGGIDSAVVAALTKKACGKNALALIMPCESQIDDERIAKLVARKIKIKTETIKLDAIYNLFKNTLKSNTKKIAYANIKSRLRMITLYYYANLNNYLVVGTGNKTELTLGYFTKYGDGGVDILPLGDLLKSEVKQLAIELKLPKIVIERKPSAGLWKGQTDEDEIGLSYDELDIIINNIRNNEKINIDKLKINKAQKMIDVSQHKRNAIPIFYK